MGEEIFFKDFYYMAILALPQGPNPWHRGHGFLNLVNGFIDVIIIHLDFFAIGHLT